MEERKEEREGKKEGRSGGRGVEECILCWVRGWSE